MIAHATFSPEDTVADDARTALAAERPTPKFGRINRFFGRLGMAGATALLTVSAVVAAELLHAVLAAARGVTLDVGMLLEVAFVATGVSLPVILYAQSIIRRLAAARRGEKAMVRRLALALDAAEQANRSKSDFLANMSHELRTPLNAVIGFSEVIRDQHLGAVGNSRYVEYAGDINDSAQHLLSIIDDVLDLSRIQAGHGLAQAENEFAVADLLSAVGRMIRPLAAREGVKLVIDPCPPDLRLVAPERMVRQSLLNIIGNAVKFTPRGGCVTVGLALRDGTLELSVSDTGIGMTPAQIVTALTPFGRVENPLSARHAGTGLGLPLAKAMIEMQGGTLRIDSIPDKGTTVLLTFPSMPLAGEGPSAPR